MTSSSGGVPALKNPTVESWIYSTGSDQKRYRIIQKKEGRVKLSRRPLIVDIQSLTLWKNLWVGGGGPEGILCGSAARPTVHR